MKKTVGVLEEDEVSQLWIAFCGDHHLLDLAFVASERIVGPEHDPLASEQLDHKLDVLVRPKRRVGVHVVESLGQFCESLDVARRSSAAMSCDEVDFRMAPCAFDQMGEVAELGCGVLVVDFGVVVQPGSAMRGDRLPRFRPIAQRFLGQGVVEGALAQNRVELEGIGALLGIFEQLFPGVLAESVVDAGEWDAPRLDHMGDLVIFERQGWHDRQHADVVDAALVHFSLHVLKRVRPAALVVHVDELAKRLVGVLGDKRPFEPALFPDGERVGHIGGLETQLVDDIVRILEYVAEMRVKIDDGLILHYVLHLKRLVIVALRNAAAAGTGKGGCSGSERGGHGALAECIIIPTGGMREIRFMAITDSEYHSSSSQSE